MKRPWALPLVPLYAAGAALRSLSFRLGIEKTRRLACPVISIGNLSTGGTGKTPFLIALANLLKRENIPIDVLSRGYGRTSANAVYVKLDGSADEFGDEPLLIAREAHVMVWVAPRRFEAGQLAEALGYHPLIHLLDDGFQHRQLARDVDIVLINSEDLADTLLPAGNLRESLHALKRAHIFAVDLADEAAASRLRALGLQQPIWRYFRTMQIPTISGPVVAFCGVARPAQFFSGLEKSGLQVAVRHAFPDHHRFTSADITTLRKLVQSTGAKALITTEKDQIRLSNLDLGVPVHTAGLVISLEDEDTILHHLAARLAAHWPQFPLK